MAITPEWRDRINNWRNELRNHFDDKLVTLELHGFVTTKHLSHEEAAKGKFKPMPAGTRWGAKWEYVWLKCSVILPASGAGKRIVFRMACDSESLVFVNGRASSLLAWTNANIVLTNNGKPGDRFDLLIETYAGHGPTPCCGGPVSPGRLTVPEPSAQQQQIKEASLCLLQEDAYQLWMDVQTLHSLRDNLEPASLRVAEIDAGLCDFTTIVDFELPKNEMLKTFRTARKRLAPLLACKNGSTAPVLYGIGHGHLDVAWLWPLAETDHKIARTLSNQLDLMAQYPEHKFLQSQAYLYRTAKKLYPELYARMKKAVKSGQLIAEGSMWVEPDMNLASGEAIIRQCIHGKRFFKEEFGIDNELLWLPDVFGYPAALPQILRGCGVKYFSTNKIFWNYHGGEAFPYNNFWWEGLDGTPILAHLFNDYGGAGDPESAIRRWNNRAQKSGISSLIYCYGHGDGGGGPARDHVESVRRLADLEGCPKVKIAGPIEFFRNLEKQRLPLNRYVGELYYQCHRGTYTSQAKTKRGNRKAETALRETEMWGAMALSLTKYKYPLSLMDETWKTLLLNQFHDILPGSSIQRVHEEAEVSLAGIIEQAEEIRSRATSALVAKRQNSITIFNSLNWARVSLVELPGKWRNACDQAGNPLPVQRMGDRTVAEISVPSCGWTSISSTPASTDAPTSALRASDRFIENENLSIRFNNKGEIISIHDKESRSEMAAGLCNSFKMYKDVPGIFDAWDIDSMYKLMPVELSGPASFKLLANGPLLAQIEITRKLNNSSIKQVVSLSRNSRRVDFQTRIDWHETHKLLKVAFPVTIHSDEAIHEIQFGHIRRPTHASRQYDADRFEVCNHKWSAIAEENRGFAILNDCKYGLNVAGNSINLTLLRAPKVPDMNADQGIQEFTYSFYLWNGSLAECGVVREAYELNCPVVTASGFAQERSVLSTDAANVIIETVKPAEDGSGDIVVRMYEAKRTATKCKLSTCLPVKNATVTDMLENGISRIKVKNGNAIALEFKPFEIKTVRLVVVK
jgi:alpha-mannosidase